MPYPPLPDVDKALVAFLSTHPALVPLHGGRVGTKLAAGTGTAVRIASLGGPQPWPWEALPEYQVEWWGGDEPAARQLARIGEAALWDILGPIPGGQITGLAVPVTQLWSPDDTSGRPRLITQVSFVVNPEAAS